MKVNQIEECDVAAPSAACLQTLFVFEDRDFELILFRHSLWLWRTSNNVWICKMGEDCRLWDSEMVLEMAIRWGKVLLRQPQQK